MLTEMGSYLNVNFSVSAISCPGGDLVALHVGVVLASRSD